MFKEKEIVELLLTKSDINVNLKSILICFGHKI